jgi:CheY-like chemotaxis protein
LQLSAQPAPKPEPPAVVAPSRLRAGLRLLLVEDNAINQLVASEMLRRQGYLVDVAANGREALAALERQTFEVVLMDVQMPEMDGFETTAALRDRESRTGAHTPVIALTAHAMKGDRERCLQAGMDGYVSKPIRADDLNRELDTILPHALGGAAIRPVNAGATAAATDSKNGV